MVLSLPLFLSFLALPATLAGCLCLYLTLPRQQWRSRPLARLPGRLAAAGLFLAGWSLWCHSLHPVTALFVGLTVIMGSLPLFPVVAALTDSRRRSPS